MAKFSGKIGFSLENDDGAETGIWDPKITEKHYYGDILNANYRWSDGSKVNPDLNVSNRFSIVANRFAIENVGSMLYVVWHGVKWQILTAEVVPPRITLYIGGIYNE